jgi:penicillin-binding protein 1A
VDGDGPRRRSLLWRWRRFFFLVGLVAVAAVAGVLYVLSRIELPPEQVQAQTSFVCAANVDHGCDANNAIALLHAEQDRVPVRLTDVAPVMVHAVLAAEDKDFYKHGGVDPVGIARAAWADLRNKGAEQGGSTITQQYVKNVYLTRERTFSRKIKEAVLAVKVEQKWSKDEILERYLNTIYFGRGAYGVGAAARTYFGKPVQQLDLPQAAYLAGLIRSPESADGARAPAAATARRARVLDAMLRNNWITASQRDQASAVPWTVGPAAAGGTILARAQQQGIGEVVGSDVGTEYFVDYVHRQLLAKGLTDAQIFTGGLRIYTTIDLDAQRAAYNSVVSTLNRPGDPNAALVAVDDKGHIKAMMGGRNFADSQVNLATGNGGSGRQAGSSMKPFVLAAAIKQGISLNSRFTAPAKIDIPKADAGKTWHVSNFGGEQFGVLGLVDATRESVNTVYAQLVMKVKPESVVPLAQQMGITSPLQPVPALVLGSEAVTPLEMASAYSTFAEGGVHTTTTGITRVEFPSGRVLTIDQPQARVFSQAEDDLVTYALRQVVLKGTATGANFGKPAAGKTGTTNDNNDAWFVGYLPNGYTAAVWMGYDPVPGPNGRLVPKLMNNVHGRAVTGGSFPATIWRQFMQQWTNGINVGNFRNPSAFPGVVLNGQLTTTVSGTSTTKTTPTTASTATTQPATSAPPPTSVTVPTTTASSTTTPASTG